MQQPVALDRFCAVCVRVCVFVCGVGGCMCAGRCLLYAKRVRANLYVRVRACVRTSMCARVPCIYLRVFAYGVCGRRVHSRHIPV